jgi:hypothetical protein
VPVTQLFITGEKKMNAADKKDLADYKEDMAAIAEKARFESEENIRREWAQANGNDSGFDPYWNLN